MSAYTIDRGLAERAFYGTSFSPEKRADTVISEHATLIKKLNEMVDDEKTQTENPQHHAKLEELRGSLSEKLTRLYRDYLYSRSSCMSPMITGPARFPTERNRKKMDSSMRKYDNVLELFNKVHKILARVTREKKTNSTEIERLQIEIEKMKALQEKMKDDNKIIRTALKKGVDLSTLDCFTWAEKKTLCIPNFMGAYGHADFELRNNLANIKSKEAKIEELKKRQNLNSSYTINGVEVIECQESDRVKLFFDGKPSHDVIQKLKSKAFKWAPSVGAWQRQLTQNASIAAKNLVNSLGS